MALTALGIFHTIIGIAAIVAAIVSFVRFGKINLTQLSGKIYFYTTTITALTALGISKHGGFNAGHVFSVFIFILVIVAFWLSVKWINRFKLTPLRHFKKPPFAELI